MDYSSDLTEKAVIGIIINSYSSCYSNLIHNSKKDSFDFESSDKTHCLEVTTILPINVINAMEYEKSLIKNKIANKNKVFDAKYNDSGELLYYHGGDLSELRYLVLRSISVKTIKAIKRIKKNKMNIKSLELALYVDDGGIIDSKKDIQYILYSEEFANSILTKIFYIGRSTFFVIEKNKITEFTRKVKG